MRIELPTAQADRLPWLTSTLVFVVALGLGLAIARGTVGARPPVSEDEGWTSDTAEPEAEAGAEADSEAGTEADSEAGTEADSEAGTEADSEAGTGAGTAAAAAEAATVAATDAAPAAPVARGPAHGTLVRGRVAYLRCEGGRSGGECNRDRAIEDAIWGHIETLPTCASAPVPGGQADLVVTLADEGASLRARDTFADDVTRLDALATVGCLESAIAAEPVLTGSARRIILSFRFSLAP